MRYLLPLVDNIKWYYFGSMKMDTEQKDPRSKPSRASDQSFDSNDCLKITLIVLLLTASLLMYRHEPQVDRPKHDTANTPDPSQAIKVTQPYDNPHGFHPFYQAHGRIEFNNPEVNLCDDIVAERALLITVLSRASNVHIREAIRQTWGGVRTYNKIDVRIVFVVGVDDGMLKQIEIEQSIFHGESSNVETNEIPLDSPLARCHSSERAGELPGGLLQGTRFAVLEPVSLSQGEVHLQGRRRYSSQRALADEARRRISPE